MAACWQEQLHYHATKSQLSAWNSTLYGLNTRLWQGKGTLRWFLESMWPATQVITTLLWYNPNPTCLAPKKCGIHLVGRLNSQLIRSYMVMTTLHTSSMPPGGMLHFFTGRTGTNHCFSCYHYHSIVPIPASLFLSLSIMLLNNHILIKPAVTLGCQSSDVEPQHTMTKNDPYSNSTSWDQHNHKWFQILHAIWMKL